MPPPPTEIGPVHDTGLIALVGFPANFASAGSSEEFWSAHRFLGGARCFEIRLPDQSQTTTIRETIRTEGSSAGATDLDEFSDCTGRLHDIAAGNGEEPLEWHRHLPVLLEDIFEQHSKGKLTDSALAAILCGISRVGVASVIPANHDAITAATAKIWGLLLAPKLDREFREEYEATVRAFMIHVGEQKTAHAKD